jgi:hypothetical protein
VTSNPENSKCKSAENTEEYTQRAAEGFAKESYNGHTRYLNVIPPFFFLILT